MSVGKPVVRKMEEGMRMVGNLMMRKKTLTWKWTWKWEMMKMRTGTMIRIDVAMQKLRQGQWIS